MYAVYSTKWETGNLNHFTGTLSITYYLLRWWDTGRPHNLFKYHFALYSKHDWLNYSFSFTRKLISINQSIPNTIWGLYILATANSYTRWLWFAKGINSAIYLQRKDNSLLFTRVSFCPTFLHQIHRFVKVMFYAIHDSVPEGISGQMSKSPQMSFFIVLNFYI